MLTSVNKDNKCASIRPGGRELLRKNHCASIKQTQKKSCQLCCIFTGKFVFHNDFVPGKFSVIKIVVKIIYSSMIIAYVLVSDDISILILLNHKKQNDFCDFEFSIRSTLNNIYCILQQPQKNHQLLLHQQPLLQTTSESTITEKAKAIATPTTTAPRTTAFESRANIFG